MITWYFQYVCLGQKNIINVLDESTKGPSFIESHAAETRNQVAKFFVISLFFFQDVLLLLLNRY